MHALGEPLAQAAPPPQIRRSRSTAIQFVASVQRQLRLASRKPCSLCIETLLPVVFVLLFALLSRLTSNTDYPDEIFATNPPLPALSMADTVRQVACFDLTQAPASHPLNSALSTLLPACSTLGQTTTCGKAPDFNPGLCYSAASIRSLRQFVDFTNATTIPSLDYITLVHVLSIIAEGPLDYDFAAPDASNSIRASGRIFFVPDAQPTRDLVSYLNSSGSSLLFQPYLYGGIMSSQSDAFAYFKSEAGAGKALAVVTVNSFSATAGLSVELSFNKSCVEWTDTDQDQFAGKFAKNYLTYFDSGFLTLEKFVLDAFVTLLGRTPDEFSIAGNAAVLAPMAHVSYTTNTFLTVSGLILPLALCLAYLYAVSQIAKRLVEEKELRLREAMAAMGVSKTTIFVSWLAFFFLLNIVTAFLATLCMATTFVSKSDVVLIFVTMLLFSMTTSALGALLSSFFSKSRTAAIATPILFFAFSIPSFALQSPSAQTINALSILSPTAFATALKLIFNYEINNGIGFGELFNKNDSVPLGQSLFMLIFDLVLYCLLTWYLDNVLSGEWGVRQHPCFCFLNCCRSKRAPSTPKDHDLGPTNVPRTLSGVGETYPPSVEDAAVVFDDVCKSFGEGEDLRVAVDRFSLKIFPGMVTAVLGHNGAGKTTLFNMLTGMLPTTDGDCYVCGASITTERDEARSYIGMCPQHNILWDDLTCLEHLRYFAWVKGTPHKDIDAEAQRLLEEVDLASKANARSSSLSGGQKRKLSVAIAFIGGSKLVLLDEPTAGMDVHTRRHTWDLIQKMARTDNRTIVLTTHFMDEAELLGDRVAMMTAGQLHCYGTPTFLKTRLGEGYTLAIQYGAPPTDETKARVLRENVCSIIRDAREKESRGREQFILLPMEDVAKFAQLLRSVESSEVKKRNGIVSVSMTVSTIEDVFVRIAHGEAGGDATAAKETARLQVDMNAANTAAQVIAAVETSPPTFLMQLVGLLKKRFNIAKRDRRALVLQVVLPILSILLAMALASAGPPGTSALIMDAHHLPDAQEGVTAGCSVGFNQGLGKSLTLINATTPSGAPSPGYYYTQEFLLSTYNHHGDTGRTVAVECMDATVPFTPSSSVPTVLISNSSAYIHAAPYSLVAWYTGRVNAGTPSSTTPPSIKIYNTPLPFTDRDSSKINGIAFALMAILIVVPFSFVPSTFCGFVVKERASKAKLLQFVSGVGYVAYWSSNMLFDLASFFVTEILAFIIFAAFSRTEYVGSGEAFFATFLVITMYGLAAIPTSYVMSLAFTNHSTAQNAVLGIFFLAGFGLTLTAYLLPLLNGPTWPVYLFRVFPPECLGEALIAIANAPGKRQIGVSLSLLDMDQAGWPLLYLGMMSIISTSVILFVDHPERIKRQQMLLYDTTKQAPSPASESPDVASERMEVEGPAGGGSDAVLRVVGLRKEYAAPAGSTASVNVAVQNLTFRVVRGEIFGLLGTNGAGKTTTMNVITGECLPSMGHAYVAGFDAVTQAGEARSLIGYCPQFDALHDLMTVDEHLALYCSLRGVRDPERISTALITAFGLSEYRRNKSKSLSGGNKRKLSVAIALVGGPQLLLLDEPTAGMDPVARRGMCDVVAAIKKHCAVVLTTHHLEEVEALADRAAIMVGGAMQCLGTLEHLKQTLGAGYQVSVRVSSEDKADACVARLCAEYPGQCKLVERHQTKLNFNVKHSDKVTLASLFDLLYNLRNAKDGAGLGVVDYTVAQSSVEEVFLAVAGGAKPHAVETYSVPMPAEASPPSPFHALL